MKNAALVINDVLRRFKFVIDFIQTSLQILKGRVVGTVFLVVPAIASRPSVPIAFEAECNV